MAKAGYYGGNPEAIMDAPVELVMDMLAYELFEADYEREYIALNREAKE